MREIKGWIKHSEAVASDKYPQYTQEYINQIYTMDHPEIRSRMKVMDVGNIPSYNLLQYVAPARYNQGDLGLCFAFAGSGIAEYYIKNVAPLGVVEELAEMFLGYYSRYILNNNQPPTGDEGSTILATAQALQQYGSCIENLWPYIDANENVEPSAAAINSAKTLEVGKYFAIPNDSNKLTAIKQSIYAGVPLMFGSEVHNSIMKVGSDGLEPYAPHNSKTDPVAGGHARYIIGWDDTIGIPKAPIKGAFLIMNSWGDKWGSDGTSWVSYQVWNDQETDDMGITSMVTPTPAPLSSTDCPEKQQIADIKKVLGL